MSTNYKAYAYTNEITAASLFIDDDGKTLIYSETVQYSIAPEDYSLLQSDLQNKRDTVAAYDPVVALAEVDAEIASVDSAKGATADVPVDALPVEERT